MRAPQRQETKTLEPVLPAAQGKAEAGLPRPGPVPGGSRSPHLTLQGCISAVGWMTDPSGGLTSGPAGPAGRQGSSQAGVSPGELGAGRGDDGGSETWLGPGSQQHGQNLKVTCSLHVNRSFSHLKWRS